MKKYLLFIMLSPVVQSFQGVAQTNTFPTSGDVGIGTTSPLSKLDIITGVGNATTNEANCLRIRHTSTNSNSQLLQLGVSNVGIGGNNNGHAYISSVYWGADDNNPLLLNPKGGPVGLGAVSGLHWNATIAGTMGIRSSASTGGNTLMGKLVFAHHSTYSANSSFIAGIYDKTFFYQGAGMVFHTISGSDIASVDGVERMRISSDGNVGIGTISPTEKLDVNGNIKVTGFVLATGAASGKVLTSDANGNATWQSASSAGWAFNGSTVSSLKSFGTVDNYDLPIITNNIERLRVLAGGSVAIGTTSLPSSDATLAVNGNIYSKKVKVTQTGWADYVFYAGYRLRPLSEVEEFIKLYKHLPEVPSALQVEKDGIDLGDNQATLLKKIEELTLYLIQQNKKLEVIEKELQQLKKGR